MQLSNLTQQTWAASLNWSLNLRPMAADFLQSLTGKKNIPCIYRSFWKCVCSVVACMTFSSFQNYTIIFVWSMAALETWILWCCLINVFDKENILWSNTFKSFFLIIFPDEGGGNVMWQDHILNPTSGTLMLHKSNRERQPCIKDTELL